VKIAFLTMIVLFAAACGDDDTAPATDMFVPVDAPPRGETCLQIITCASGCAGGAPCQEACTAAGSAQAQMQYQSLFACAYDACIVAPTDAGSADDAGATEDAGASDGGVGTCTGPEDMSAGCQACVSASAQGAACSAVLSGCLTGR